MSAATRELLQMLEKRRLPVIGAGDYFYPSSHLDDAARAIVSALAAPAGVYNVCDGAPVRWSEFLDRAARLIGAGRPLARAGDSWPTGYGTSLALDVAVRADVEREVQA